MKPLTSIVLCNDVIALPALLTLAFHQQLKAVCIPERNKDMILEARQTLPAGINIIALRKNEWIAQVKKTFTDHQADLGFLMTFPWKLDLGTISLPSKGFFNFHYGSLPEYRGADPVFYQVRNRAPFAGLTIHKVEESVDEGGIFLQDRIKLDTQFTYGQLKNELGKLGSAVITKCMDILSFSDKLITRPQDNSQATWYDKPGLNEVMINWGEMGADSVIALVNACNPWNKGAGTIINGMGIKILEAERSVDTDVKNLPAGQINFLNSGMPEVGCADGSRLILKIIYTPEGFRSGDKLKALGVRQGDHFA